MFKYLSIYKGKHETLSINFRTDTFFFSEIVKTVLFLKECMDRAGDYLSRLPS